MRFRHGIAILIVAVTSACGASQHDAEEASGDPPSDSETAAHDAADDDDGTTRGTAREPVQCGGATCGPNEYCEIRCTCCGAYIPEPSRASADYVCVPLPESCATGGGGPECDQRTVHTPCA